MGSLFPSLSNNATNGQPAQSSSLFGTGNNAAANQQSGRSLFGAAMTPSLSGSTLFGSGNAQPQAQPANASGLSLFGNTSTQPTATGLSNPTAANTAATSSQTGSGTTASGTATVDASQAGRQTSDMNGLPRPALFDNLLERGKKRAAESNLVGDGLPSLNLGLSDISSKIRNIGVDAPAANIRLATQKNSVQQRQLNHSFSRPLSSAREAKSSSGYRRSDEAGASGLDDADVDQYVAYLSAKSTRDLINESLEQSKHDFDAFLEDSMEMNWEEQRRRIYEHFGLTRAVTTEGLDGSSTLRGSFARSSLRGRSSKEAEKLPRSGAFGKSSMSRSMLGGSMGRKSMGKGNSIFADVADKKAGLGLPNISEDPYLRVRQDKYATKVKALNISRIRQVGYPLIEEFAESEAEIGSDVSKHLIDAFKALKSIVKEPASRDNPGVPNAISERHYAHSYLEQNSSSGDAVALRRRILDGSRTFLEQDFFSRLEDTIAKSPREANVGGMPSKIQKVRAYIRLRATRRDLAPDNVELQMLGEDYCWALIFYLLRSGLVADAAEYVAMNERAIKSMDRNFPAYMLSYSNSPERRLPRDQQIRINAEYLQRSRLSPESALDPFKMACIKIIGRCEVGRRSIDGIKTSIEDFLWLTFALAREVDRIEESASDVFGLEEVQSVVEDISARHFGPGSESSLNYSTLFLMEILSGMFEHAIAWLYQHNTVSAVHFAIALDFYGLLRVSDLETTSDQLLSYTTRQKPQISFGLMLRAYVADFQVANTEAAADYLILIALNGDLPGPAGQAQAALCHDALKELVLETREFALLLGDIQSNGRRLPGVIEHRIALIRSKDRESFLQSLTLQAAVVADDNGRTTDAALLYHLAQDYNKVVMTVNRAVSDSLAASPGAEPVKLEPLKPRANAEGQSAAAAAAAAAQASSETGGGGSSLSLTAVDDPVVLARNFLSLYGLNAAYFSRVQRANREAGELLLRMADARDLVVRGQWTDALNEIAAMGILPLAGGSGGGGIRSIQSYAQGLNALQPLVARNVGQLLVWAVECIGRLRWALKTGAFVAQARAGMADELLGKAQDCMMFAGSIRYKIGPEVYEVLARIGNAATA